MDASEEEVVDDPVLDASVEEDDELSDLDVSEEEVDDPDFEASDVPDEDSSFDVGYSPFLKVPIVFVVPVP